MLRRRTMNLFGAFILIMVFYGSLMPFELDPELLLTWRLDWHRPAPGDFLANIMLYVPIGAFLRLLVRRRGTGPLWECAAALLVVGGISYLTEVLQTLLPARVPSATDVATNVGGAAVGVLAAPLLQRAVRNLHAWLYHTLRTRPLTLAATAVTFGIWMYGLAPFDAHPTPGFVKARWQEAQNAESILPFGGGFGGDSPMSRRQAVDKVVSAGTYGLLACLLLLAARESGRGIAASTWIAFTRACAMAAAIEMVQFFTVSHVADAADLTAGWMCAAAGTLVGAVLVAIWRELHREPIAVLRRLMIVVTGVLMAWAGLSLYFKDQPAVDAPASWLPIVSHFHRPWNSVLGDYALGLLRYTLLSCVLVMWCRSRGKVPREGIIVAAVGAAALLGAAVGIYRELPVDTGQFVLALMGGAIGVRLDRAFFEDRGAAETWLSRWSAPPRPGMSRPEPPGPASERCRTDTPAPA